MSIECLPEIDDEDRQFLHYNPNTSDLVEFVRAYARKALVAERERVIRLLAAIRGHWVAAIGADSLAVGALDQIACVIVDGVTNKA